ncbi:monovalent cation/H(+) antiporter subunit G [soil metagenome]
MGEVLALAGAILTLLAAIGVVRFPDALSRMHALTKASTVGLVLVAVGGALVLPTANDITSAVLAAVLYVATLPIAGAMMARATYFSEEAPNRLHTIDELAKRRRADTSDPSR